MPDAADGSSRASPAGSRPAPALVEVAIDAAGGGGARTYTYHLPPSLAEVAPGEAVLVEYGRRQALGIVLGAAAPSPGVSTKPVLERVRSDGPLLPPLGLAFARWIAAEYLAPPALVLRAMLPPGLLERLELMVELTDGGPALAGRETGREGGREAAAEAADELLLGQLAGGSRPARSLDAPEGRAGLLRRLHGLESRGLVRLEWTLTVAAAGPRYERWARLTPEGVSAAAAIAAGETPAGRPLGPRQTALLGELHALGGAMDAGADGTPAPPLAERYGGATLASLARRGLIALDVRERPRLPLAARAPGMRGARPPGATLTAPQAEAVRAIAGAVAARDPTPFLVEGVTGGGKTAVYVEAIAASLEAGRPVLVLVPEISLALPLVDRLRADLQASVAVLHSGLGEGERADEWRRIRAGVPDIVVGTRMAVTAPLADVGLIIVDEEHDAAYKSDRTPRLQARDAAVALGRLAGATVILGSATPAVESVGRARLGLYRAIVLPERPSGAPPVIELVDLRAELAAGNRGLLSERLVRAVAQLDTAAGDQAILVLNRRGSASVVLCRDCGHVQACAECGRPLVFHQAGNTLRCHHCGSVAPPASRCPACRSARIRYLGGGTERVEAAVRERFPRLRVGRLDRDVVERRGAATRVIDAFTSGELDVLVGTSLVAKGLDIPHVTLVGIVSADVALNLPDERASERTYQLLAQAVGRAGRGDRPGRAVIQTYQPEHPAIQAVVRHDAAAFYDAELVLRERFRSPPFGRLVKLTVGLPDRAAAERAAAEMAERLRARASERRIELRIAGPLPSYIPRRAGRWRYDLVLRGDAPAAVVDGGPGAPWSVDVDPESLL